MQQPNKFQSYKSLNKLLTAVKLQDQLFIKPEDSLPDSNSPEAQARIIRADSEISSHGDLESLSSVSAFTLQQKRNQLFDGNSWKRPIPLVEEEEKEKPLQKAASFGIGDSLFKVQQISAQSISQLKEGFEFKKG
jgi:hypothetical protein